MSERSQFESRDIFRQWLQTNCLKSSGVWLVFGKTGGPKTIKANEALEEALCFGWIDGQMQSIDEKHILNIFLCEARRANGLKRIRLLLMTL